MISDITRFDAMAAWFSFSDNKDHFHLTDGTDVEVDFFDINSVLENKKYMKEIGEILEKRRKFVKSKRRLKFLQKKFYSPIRN